MRPLAHRTSPLFLVLAGLFACQRGSPTQQPSDPVTTTPEAEPTSGPLTWADVRETLAGATDYTPTAHADPPAWLAQVDTLWVRVGEQCQPITLSENREDPASLEQCHEAVGKADVVCATRVEVGSTFQDKGWQLCRATLPSGAGRSGASMGGRVDPASIWSLVASDDDVLRYAKTWSLSAEAAQLVWVEYACSESSVATLNETLLSEGISEAQRGEVLNQRHGVVGTERRCLEHHGARLYARPSHDRNFGDRAASSRREPGVHDCTIACPESGQSLPRIRSVNGVLRAQPFARVDDDATLVLHREASSCEATVDGGLPAPADNPCRAFSVAGP